MKKVSVFKTIIRPFLTVLVTSLWVSASEFFRNQVLLKDQWISHFDSLGVSFPQAASNSMVWGIWSLAYAFLIYILAKRMSFTETCFTAWFAGFVLMWLVIGNLSVLPTKILWFAIPLSILETYVATWITTKLIDSEKQSQ
jgi:hypothetical protein